MHLRHITTTSGPYRNQYLAITKSLWSKGKARTFNILMLGRLDGVHLRSAELLLDAIDETCAAAPGAPGREQSPVHAAWRWVWYRFLQLSFRDHQDEIRRWVAKPGPRPPVSKPMLTKLVRDAQDRRMQLVTKLIGMLVGWEMTSEALTAEFQSSPQLIESTLDWLQLRGAPLQKTRHLGQVYWHWAQSRPGTARLKHWALPE